MCLAPFQHSRKPIRKTFEQQTRERKSKTFCLLFSLIVFRIVYLHLRLLKHPDWLSWLTIEVLLVRQEQKGGSAPWAKHIRCPQTKCGISSWQGVWSLWWGALWYAEPLNVLKTLLFIQKMATQLMHFPLNDELFFLVICKITRKQFE